MDPFAHKLAEAVAREIMHWRMKDGMWWRGGSCTGLKVAKGMLDYPEEGFFRPDRNLFHMSLVRFKVVTDTSAAYDSTFPGNKIRVVYNDGDGCRGSAVDEYNLLDDSAKETHCLAMYRFILAWREKHEKPGTRTTHPEPEGTESSW